MLFFRVHLAEADVVAMRLEDRIIAETPVPARRPDDGAVDAALERLHMAVGPGEGKRADEMRAVARFRPLRLDIVPDQRSEEHTSELQSLMRISYAVFCLKKKTKYRQTPAH